MAASVRDSALAANRSIPDATIIPVLNYADVREAAAWLCRAFGFAERVRIGSHRVQLAFGAGAVVVAERPGDLADESPVHASHSIMVRVTGIDAHCERAQHAGARIAREPTDHPYGERQYTAVDPGGHVWTFTQTIADVDPRDWGGETVAP